MSSYRPLSAVVLAAGEGTRMRSATPKVLHPLCGRPMLLHVLDALVQLPLERIVVVVGHGAEDVTKTVQEQLVTDIPVEFVEQRVQRGTGDADRAWRSPRSPTTSTARTTCSCVCGDVPLLRPETLAVLATEHRLADAAATLLTAALDDPDGLRPHRARRAAAASSASSSSPTPPPRSSRSTRSTRRSTASGAACSRRRCAALSPENAQGEYYLTDVIAVLRQAGHTVLAVEADDPTEALGVNDRAQLAAAEAVLRERINDALDARRRHDGRPGAHLHRRDGRARRRRAAAARARSSRVAPSIGARLGDRARHARSSTPSSATTCGHPADGRASSPRSATACTVGPYVLAAAGHAARPPARTSARSSRSKNAEIGEGAKVPHLAYVGDAEIGPERQHRRRHDHRQLRRPQQAPHEDRRRRPHRVEHRAGRAGRGRRRRVHGRGRGGEPRRAARRARQGRAGADRRRLGDQARR